MSRAFKIAAAVALMGFTLGAQASKSVMTGVYTEQQALRGKEIYADQCRLCHGRDLEGGYESHPLVGDEFTSNWQGEDLFKLFERIRVTMSAGASGVNGKAPPPLTASQTADLVAFLLYFNGVPAGKSELSTRPEELKQLKFETPAP